MTCVHTTGGVAVVLACGGHALIFVMVPWFMFIGTLVAFFYLYHMPQGESVPAMGNVPYQYSSAAVFKNRVS